MSKPPPLTTKNNKTKKRMKPLVNGMEMDADMKFPTLLGSLGKIFDTIDMLEPPQKAVLNKLFLKILFTPVIILTSITNTVKRVIIRIITFPISLVRKVSAICDSLQATFAKLNRFFNRLIDMGLSVKRVIAMTIKLFATVLTAVVEKQIHEYDAYIGQLSNLGISIGMDAVKAIPVAGTAVALGNMGTTAMTTTDDVLDDVADNMSRIERTIDKSIPSDADLKKQMFRKRIRSEVDPNAKKKK